MTQSSRYQFDGAVSKTNDAAKMAIGPGAAYWDRPLVLQLYFAGIPQEDKTPGLKAPGIPPLFRGLKAPAPSDKAYLQL